jgi:hypothetical protein
MTIQAQTTAQNQREQWLDRVSRLVDQIEAWAEARGWSTHRDVKAIEERDLGRYTVPTLRVRTPQGEVHVNPIARRIMGADGRVDIEAWPSLNRVKLVPVVDGWRIITDSNVLLTTPWVAESFATLAEELTAR